ncbi:hypothetical protein [Croceibacter atlanticus]|uniref:hypothetical protein n=1 Tax=Croceibacter atlanticus TaxID=313588 RepID=UPI0030D9FFDA|tara:strand:+ start:12139 stop:12639 length:501 start_codon:yes stop_codon:yes gene_type:complete
MKSSFLTLFALVCISLNANAFIENPKVPFDDPLENVVSLNMDLEINNATPVSILKLKQEDLSNKIFKDSKGLSILEKCLKSEIDFIEGILKQKLYVDLNSESLEAINYSLDSEQIQNAITYSNYQDEFRIKRKYKVSYFNVDLGYIIRHNYHLNNGITHVEFNYLN